MGAFLKLASLGVTVGGGSLLALWLNFNDHRLLARLTLAGMAVGAVVVIVAIARDTRRVDGTVQ